MRKNKKSRAFTQEEKDAMQEVKNLLKQGRKKN